MKKRSVGRYVRDFFSNWSEYGGSMPSKLRLTARNRFIAFGTLKGCCGHPGEPGC